MMPATRASSSRQSVQPPVYSGSSSAGKYKYTDGIEISVVHSPGREERIAVKTSLAKKKKEARKPLIPIGDVIEISSDDDDRPPIAAPPSPTQKLRRQIKKLKEENDKYKQDLMKVKQELTKSHAEISELKLLPQPGKGKLILDAGQLEDNVNCEICTAKMWLPHILPECGHTFCQSCLQDWFGTTLAQFMTLHPHYNVNAPHPYAHHFQAFVGQNPYMHHAPHAAAMFAQYQQLVPQYTCPTCREVVKSRPVEDFALKALVRTVARAAGENSPERPQVVTYGGVRGRLPAPRLNGPWDKFFPKPRA
ncbi:hypothetical protein BDZ94DRAFT_1249139 [Collybia nuda]|uniref:RING-type domain-containing protein n=1 Tax=Collybia nuda TaxID=64659 RepID=A0A9P5YEF5_9AGAR|nr:hypothetical protein BDZ94DRAFT_1249139 [Collybia nuda]